PWDVGVEQLGHVPAEHERRDDRVPGGVGAVGALGRCHGAPSSPSWGGGGPGVQGICARLARTLGMLANAALPDKARPKPPQRARSLDADQGNRWLRSPASSFQPARSTPAAAALRTNTYLPLRLRRLSGR